MPDSSLEPHQPLTGRRVDPGEWIGIALLASIFALALFNSWDRWLDPIIDAGRDLYIPAQLLGGQKLYRDILYFYPPLTPYLLAAITFITGPSLAAYRAIGIAMGLLTATLLWSIARNIASPPAAFVTTLLFLALNLTGASTWGCNFIFPYAHAATFAMLFFLAYIFFFLRHLFDGRRRADLVLALFFSVLSASTKLEYALFTSVTLLLIGFLHRLPITAYASFFGAGGVIVAACTLAFRDAPAGQHWLFDNVLASSLLGGPTAKRFYSRVVGSDRLGQAALQITEGALLVFAVIGLLAILHRLSSWPQARLRTAAKLSALAGVGLVSISLTGPQFFRAWSALQLILLPIALLRERHRPLLPLLLFSLCATSRIYLNVAPVWYGFVFTLPLYLLITYVLLVYLPERDFYSRRLALLWLIVLIPISVQGLLHQHSEYQRKSEPVATTQGRFLDSSSSRARAITELVKLAREQRPASLAVVPEGLSINYFTGIPTPLSFQTFTPIETADRETEKRIIGQFELRRPEWVVLVSRDVSEFGFRGFGIDYNQQLARTISQRYQPVRRWQSEDFVMVLFRVK